MSDSNQVRVSKEKILKLMAMTEAQVKSAFFVLPYNIHGEESDCLGSTIDCWFDINNDPCIMIGREFWDFIGGHGTYDELIRTINQLGIQYKRRIYETYLHMAVPDDFDDFILE